MTYDSTASSLKRYLAIRNLSSMALLSDQIEGAVRNGDGYTSIKEGTYVKCSLSYSYNCIGPQALS